MHPSHCPLPLSTCLKLASGESLAGAMAPSQLAHLHLYRKVPDPQGHRQGNVQDTSHMMPMPSSVAAPHGAICSQVARSCPDHSYYHCDRHSGKISSIGTAIWQVCPRLPGCGGIKCQSSLHRREIPTLAEAADSCLLAHTLSACVPPPFSAAPRSLAFRGLVHL